VSEAPLRYEKRGHVAVITFNRPEVRNAVSPEMGCRLVDAWRDFAADDELRVAIITGAGDRAFTAGADLGTLIPLLTGARPPEDDWDRRILADREAFDAAVMLRGEPVYKPIIAAVNGVSVGLGTELLQATDLRVAAEHATFAVNEVKRGFMPGGGSTVRLSRQIPLAKTMEMILLGDPISAAEAHRIGLINEVLPAVEVLPRAEELAEKIAANGPVAVRKAKETILRTLALPYEDGYLIERENAELTMATDDAREGPRAFIEKRPPVFRGR
jgi:enoyl-CoA hydratase/carnithine racemase